MSDSAINRYDQVPYSNYPIRDSHPIGLEAIATLFGMRPAAIPGARVLELGCASGGNLIPQAQDFPQASFLGVDLSLHQIESGQATIRALGLKNIELRPVSILDLDASCGLFDYILCHGVYSWVPPEVQTKILQICRENLSPQGVAFVSYNVLPGWHLRQAIREMILYHTAQFADPATQITQSRKLLDFLEETASANTAWGMLLHSEVELLKKTTDAYIYHEHLEEVNEPCYFHEFAARAEAAGLQYLADTELGSMVPTHLPEKAKQVLASVPQIRKEQYMDFIRNRTFRKTLLCHAEVKLDRTVPLGVLEKFCLALPKAAVRAAAINADGEQGFTIGNSTLSTRDPLVIEAIDYLSGIYPQFAPFPQVLEAAVANLPAGSPALSQDSLSRKQSLLAALASILFSGMLDLAIHPPRFARQASDRPKATPLARWQAERGLSVTNRRHEMVKLDDITRHILCRLDGKHHLGQVREDLTARVRSGQMKLREGEKPVSALNSQAADGLIQQILSQLSSNALLVN